jgi:hypothetical protein
MCKHICKHIPVTLPIVATISKRDCADGTTSFVVSYRFGGRGSKQGALTFKDRKIGRRVPIRC